MEMAVHPERRKKRIEISDRDQLFLNTLRQNFGEQVRSQKGSHTYLTREKLGKLLRIKDSYLAGNLFRVMDSDGDGRLSEEDVVKTASAVILGSDQKKLRFIFDVHDADGNGKISREELDRMFKAVLRHSSLKITPRTRLEVESALFDHAGGKHIDFSAFRNLLSRDRAVRSAMLGAVSTWFGRTGETRAAAGHISFSTVLRYIFVVLPYYVWRGLLIAAYIGANLYFFTHAFFSYRAAGANLFIQIARGGGACLNFNGMLILIPMMRTLLTWIRKTFLFVFVPVDQNVEIHKLIGRVMFFFALVHTAAHLANYYSSGASLTEQLFHTRVGLTGVITMGAFLIIWLFSMEFIRKSKSHRLFSLTHLLYMAWFPAAMIHVRSFTQWTIIPVTGLVIELLIRKFVKTRQTFIDECLTHDTGVTHLTLHRPEKFSFKPGEYLFLQVPRISAFGWHPFTISSAPEKQESLDVHVRALGTWTKRLYSEMDRTPKEKRRLPARIHGPYGAPATRIFNSKCAVLIGAGIGVTPFASILESIIMRREQNIKMNLEKVYFYWVYREQETFQWFARLLSRIEEKNHRMLDINIYMTNARIDPLTGLLKIGMDLRRRESHADALTGLQSKTNFGRPDWNGIFDSISEKHKLKRVNVFYCGPYPMGSAIRQAAHHRGFHFRMENF